MCDHTIARTSFSGVLDLFSASFKLLDQYQIGCLLLPKDLCSWTRTAPIFWSDASVSKEQKKSFLGSAKTGAFVTPSMSSSKAFSSASPKDSNLMGCPSVVSLYNGEATLEYPAMNLRKRLHIPRKKRSSVMVRGWDASVKLATVGVWSFAASRD